ncbi:MAG: DUF1622 domain-containing protein [Micrococcaceae bacterium]
MVIGFIIAIIFSLLALSQGRGGPTAFQLLRKLIGSSILLGLEVLVAADLIRTMMTPTLNDALVLGIIVIIRTVLSLSIQIEIEGVLPWKKAMLESGGQVFAREITKETTNNREHKHHNPDTETNKSYALKRSRSSASEKF